MLKDKVADSIHKDYPNADTSHLIDSAGRITGYVVDDQFQETEIRNSIDKIWARLRADLGAEAVNVGFLLLLSPDVEKSARDLAGVAP